MAARVFVDKIEERGIGGSTTSLLKIKHNLSVVNQTFEGIMAQTKGLPGIPLAMFHIGRYAVIFQSDREGINARMAFIDYQVDLDENFDHFADFLTPKIVSGFRKLQTIIEQKPDTELEVFILSEDPLFFETESQN